MNSDSTTIPSHRPSITRFNPVVNDTLDYLRPLVKDEDILWIQNAYKHCIKDISDEARLTLHCWYWAVMIHCKLSYIEDNVILMSPKHTVCRVGGYYIDISNNAILSDFDWLKESYSDSSSSIYRLIDSTEISNKYRTTIQLYYIEKANKIIKYSSRIAIIPRELNE
jgi:hypothetical protein